MKICSQLPCFPGRSNLWVSREFLLESGVGCLDKAKSQAGKEVRTGYRFTGDVGRGRRKIITCVVLQS